MVLKFLAVFILVCITVLIYIYFSRQFWKKINLKLPDKKMETKIKASIDTLTMIFVWFLLFADKKFFHPDFFGLGSGVFYIILFGLFSVVAYQVRLRRA